MSPSKAESEDYAAVLVEAAEAALGPWVERSVARRAVAAFGSVPPAMAAEAHDAGLAARRDVGRQLRELLSTDVDEQRTNPLSVLRSAVRYPTAVLRTAGVAPVPRDEFSRRAFPEDDYDLTPATWGDLDPSLHEPGIVWGAWKASVVLRRRRQEGRS